MSTGNKMSKKKECLNEHLMKHSNRRNIEFIERDFLSGWEACLAAANKACDNVKHSGYGQEASDGASLVEDELEELK